MHDTCLGAIHDRTCMNVIECVVFCLFFYVRCHQIPPHVRASQKNGGRRSNDACRAECAGEKKVACYGVFFALHLLSVLVVAATACVLCSIDFLSSVSWYLMAGLFLFACVCMRSCLPSILFSRKAKSRFLSPGLLWRGSSGNCLHSVRRWLDLSPPCREEWLPNGISSLLFSLSVFSSRIRRICRTEFTDGREMSRSREKESL